MMNILQPSTLPNITTIFYDDPGLLFALWNDCFSETFKPLLVALLGSYVHARLGETRE